MQGNSNKVQGNTMPTLCDGDTPQQAGGLPPSQHNKESSTHKNSYNIFLINNLEIKKTT